MTRHVAAAAFVAAALALPACVMDIDSGPDDPPRTTEQPFAEGGTIDVQIDKGDCDITNNAAAAIRVTLSGHVRLAISDITLNGPRATVTVRQAPQNKFHCTVDVPKAEELTVTMGGGDLRVGDIATRTDVQTGAGDTDIIVGTASDYASVEAVVGAGDLAAGPFGGGQSGIAPKFNWTGPGKRTLVAHLGAGDLRLRRQ
ncbi:MAG TPA: hypothetical protein VHZ73_13055 [Vicinamibacterales bacterium]|nr:hypothetical protein [Vicinamibacterales bacterium]